MAKRYRNHRKKPKTPLRLMLWMIGGGVVLIAVALFMVFGGGSENGGGTPSLSVDQQTIDYGDVKLATNLTFQIKVTNLGDGVLRFKDQPYIEVLEGC